MMSRSTPRSSAVAAMTVGLLLSLAPAYAAEAPSQVLVAASEDGDAFDLDEYDGDADRSEITVTLSDLGGQPVAPAEGQELRWFWTVTPFDGTERRRVPSEPGAYESDSTPRDTATYDVVLPAGEGSGTYRLLAALASSEADPDFVPPYVEVAAYRAGQARLAFSQPTGRWTSEWETPVRARLSLEDGTGLPSRVVTLDYAPSEDPGNGRTAGFLPSPDADRPRPADTRVARLTDAGGEVRTTLAGYEPPGRCWIPDGSSEIGTLSASSAGSDQEAPGDRPDGLVGAQAEPVMTMLNEPIADRFPPYLEGRNNGRKADRLVYSGHRSDGGERIRLYRVLKNRTLRTLVTKRLDVRGDARFVVADRNGRRTTTYAIKVLRSRTTCGTSVSHARSVR